jgi:hypothetical protein
MSHFRSRILRCCRDMYIQQDQIFCRMQIQQIVREITLTTTPSCETHSFWQGHTQLLVCRRIRGGALEKSKGPGVSRLLRATCNPFTFDKFVSLTNFTKRSKWPRLALGSCRAFVAVGMLVRILTHRRFSVSAARSSRPRRCEDCDP